MAKDLHGYQIPALILEKKAAAEAKGYRFLPFDYSYTLELLEFLNTEFGGGWKRNALIAMQEGTAEDLIWLILAPEGSICGFCMWAIDRNPMRFGPSVSPLPGETKGWARSFWISSACPCAKKESTTCTLSPPMTRDAGIMSARDCTYSVLS